jgi:hypothetical protein
MLLDSARIASFVAGPDYDTDLFDVGEQNLFDEDSEHRPRLRVTND